MKKSPFVCLAISFFMIVWSNLFAQDENPVLSMEVTSHAIANNFSPDSLPLITDSTVYAVGMKVSLYDSTNIRAIEVSLGSTSGSSDIFSYSFQFDVSSVGNGMAYSRNGLFLNLGLGQLTGLQDYFAQVRVERLDGSFSPAILFNR